TGEQAPCLGGTRRRETPCNDATICCESAGSRFRRYQGSFAARVRDLSRCERVMREASLIAGFAQDLLGPDVPRRTVQARGRSRGDPFHAAVASSAASSAGRSAVTNSLPRRQKRA